MKRIKLFIAGLLFALLASGCGEEGSYSTGGGYHHSGGLKVYNHSSSYDAIWHVYISNAGINVWGGDQLGSSRIYPGESKVWTIEDCDRNYDLKVIYRDGTTRYARNEYISCGRTTVFTAYDY